MQFELHGFKILMNCWLSMRTGVTGIKPANLVSCPTASMPVVAPLLADYTEQLPIRGLLLKFYVICAARTLILVYQPQQLEDLLQKQAISCYLQELGYKSGSVHSLLRQLGARYLAAGFSA